MWGLSLEKLWTSRCSQVMGSLAPEAADLAMKDLGHVARREQGQESALERKDAVKP